MLAIYNIRCICVIRKPNHFELESKCHYKSISQGQEFYDILNGQSGLCYENEEDIAPFILDNTLNCDDNCSSHGPGREVGGLELLDEGCRNYSDMAFYNYGSINIPYWINMESMSTISNAEHRNILINDIREQIELWNEVVMHDGSGKLVNIYEVGQNSTEKPENIDGKKVIEVVRENGSYAGLYTPSECKVRFNYNVNGYGKRPGRNVDTPMHEFGHVLGLYDLDGPESITNGTHKTLMGYDRFTTEATLHKAIKYQDIQGVAVVNNIHTCEDEYFKRYIIKDGKYLHICFYCDRIDASYFKIAESQEVQNVSDCIHEYQQFVSAGERHWLKCTKCYKVIESDFFISGDNSSQEIIFCGGFALINANPPLY